MIRRLKTRFILLSLSALFILLTVIVSGMNLLNWRAVVSEADATLLLLSENEGTFPLYEEGDNDWLPSDMSPEIPFESRFFSVLTDSSGKVTHTETESIYMVNSETASWYAENAMKKNNDRGFVEHFRYISTADTSGIRITFLDCGRKLALYYDFAVFSIVMSLLGYSITAIVICFFAGRFIRPVAESYEKQKRFITDAGHEIKTPLTIIRANVDVLKMDSGSNVHLDDIERQTRYLTKLTNDLVSLARMEESKKTLQMISFPVSDVIRETAGQFLTLAQTQKKEITYQIQPMCSMYGDEKEISRLIAILLDNALKYSPEGSQIRIIFERQWRKQMLTVSNPSAVRVTDEDLRRVFDRFFRADPSRNSETGGNGIGLSMAQAIVLAHGGRISAGSPDGTLFVVTIVFPV